MQPAVVMLVYGAALMIALALLYFFHARWYWHVLSLAAALAIGLTPLPPEWNIPDLVVGFVFLLLFGWGFAAPFFRTHHAHRQLKHRA
jgi:hypothetical protein